MQERATIDFETRSEADLPEVGAFLYACDPSTEIMCLSFHLPGYEPKRVGFWHMAHPDIGISETPIEALQPLFDYIATGGKIEAHNAEFEENIWREIAVKRLGWPAIPDDAWIDSAAKAAAQSLPRDLGGAGAALNLPTQKDAAGKALLKKYTKPKKLVKKERDLFGKDAVIFNEDVEGLHRFWEYNKQDVRAEVRFSAQVPDLSPIEYRIWQSTQRMNRRGVLFDRELCEAALDLVDKARAKLNAELFRITGIQRGSQRAEIKDWLASEENLDLPNTTAKTLEWYLERNADALTPTSKRVIEIVREVNRTSPSKYKRMLRSMDELDRVRGLLVYCGAERTGRFAGRGIQIHNLPKGKLPKGISMDSACADVKTRDLAWCELIYGDVMNLIVSCLRGAIIAPPGRDFVAADYAAIEARVVLWLAGATAALKIFERGEDIYCDMASGIFGRPIVKDKKALAKAIAAGIKNAATPQVITSQGATERDFGKVAILGLGYNMGYIKFLLTLRDYKIYLTRAEVQKMMGAKRLAEYEKKIRKKFAPTEGDFRDSKSYKSALRESKVNRRRLTDEREEPDKVMHELALCLYTVETYRARYAEVKQLWKDQENSAIRAVQNPGKVITCGKVKWLFKGRFLKCRLPSGRCLHYCDPEIKYQKTAWGESRPSLRFMGKDQKTKKWTRQASYGGKLVENITQATARDIMALAQVKLEDEEIYDLILTVHDEIIAEVDEGEGSPDAFEAVMSTLDECFAGCPITAEAKRYKRYRKG